MAFKNKNLQITELRIFDYLNTVFGVFASENAPAYPLCIKKEVFMKDSNGNSVSVSSSKLQTKN